MLVSTVHKPSERSLQLAKIWSDRLGCPLVYRNGLSISKLQAMDNQKEVLIVSEQEVKCYLGDDPPFFFHPSTALIRLKRLLKGERDVLLNVASVEAGDIVLDCTAGLASDSIVFSYATGLEGCTIAVEQSPLLYWLAKDGLSQYRSDIEPLNEAMRRIKLIHADHYEYLRSLPDRSIDVIYFDPMFRTPVVHSSAMQPLRHWAASDPISSNSILEAERVARKTIVLKEHRDSLEFSRLGFTNVHRTYSNIAYGVMHL